MFCAWTAYGDTFLLKNDGQIEGTLVNAEDKWAAEYTIRTNDGGQITIPRTQVKEIVRPRDAEVTYEKIAPTYPDTVEGQMDLANWCAKNYLSVVEKNHLKRVIELSPDHEKARHRLNYEKYQGEWLTKDEVLKRKGLLTYNGRARTAQEIELIEQRKQTDLKEKSWFAAIKRIREDLDSRDRSKAEAAKAKLLSLDDPNSVKAIVFYFDRENDKKAADLAKAHIMKLWLVEVLAKLGEGDALTALVNYSLDDRDEEVRIACLEAVSKHRIAAPVNRYMAALKDKENDVVQRAAIGLRYMGDRRAIGPLIEALVTQHVYELKTNQATGNGSITTTFDKSGRSGGGGLGVNTKPQKIRKHIYNEEVHNALTQMTGQDFGFDQKQWRSWLATQKETPRFDGRRG
jgi:hypothetical protein